MKPDYFVNSKEHVMSYGVWKTLKERDVIRIIGKLTKDVK